MVTECFFQILIVNIDTIKYVKQGLGNWTQHARFCRTYILIMVMRIIMQYIPHVELLPFCYEKFLKIFNTCEPTSRISMKGDGEREILNRTFSPCRKTGRPNYYNIFFSFRLSVCRILSDHNIFSSSREMGWRGEKISDIRRKIGIALESDFYQWYTLALQTTKLQVNKYS